MKMKQVWSSPKTSFEQFVPQNYIAACGESGTVYKFTCDAPGGALYYFPNNQANTTAPSTGTRGTRIGGSWSSYSPCKVYHEAESNSGFYWGYVDYDSDGRMDSDEMVIVWRGENNNNGHATKQLDMTKWETAKS